MSTNEDSRVFWQNVRRSCEEFEFNFGITTVDGTFGPSYCDDYAYMLTTSYQNRRLKRPILKNGELRRYSKANEQTGIVLLDSFLFSPLSNIVSLRSVMVAVDPQESQPFVACSKADLSETQPEEGEHIKEDFYQALAVAALKGSRFFI